MRNEDAGDILFVMLWNDKVIERIVVLLSGHINPVLGLHRHSEKKWNKREPVIFFKVKNFLYADAISGREFRSRFSFQQHYLVKRCHKIADTFCIGTAYQGVI